LHAAAAFPEGRSRPPSFRRGPGGLPMAHQRRAVTRLTDIAGYRFQDATY